MNMLLFSQAKDSNHAESIYYQSMLVIVSPPLLFPKAPGSMVQGLWGSFPDKEFSKYDFLRLAKIVHGLYKMVYLFSSLDLLWLSQSKTPAPAAWIYFQSMLFHCFSLLFDSPQICGRCGSGGYQFLWLLRKKRGELPLPCELLILHHKESIVHESNQIVYSFSFSILI